MIFEKDCLERRLVFEIIRGLVKTDPLTENDQLVAAIIARHGNVVVDLLNYDHEKTPLSISLIESDGPLLRETSVSTSDASRGVTTLL